MTNAGLNGKIGVQRKIFAGALVLFVCKAFAFSLTHSVGILSDTLESTVNIITGYVTLQSLVFAAKPRDDDHPYGHGKVELITASLEGILIGVAGILIIIEAVHRLGQPVTVVRIDTGIIIMTSTALANAAMGYYSIRMGKKFNSIGLIAGGKHLYSDMVTTLALIAGLAALYFTGMAWIDSSLAIVFGGVILYTAYDVLRKTVNGLMDETDPAAIRLIVEALNKGRRPGWIDIHRLTHLTFGNVAHVDLHLTLPWYLNVRESTEEIQQVKQLIRSTAPDIELDISIQSEPCLPSQCRHCLLACPHRNDAFTERIIWTSDTIIGKNPFPLHT